MARAAMVERKIAAMHKRFGTCGVFRCKECEHLCGGKYHDRQYYKCELYGYTRGESTDWRLAYQACGMYNMPVDMDRWEPILEQIKHSKKPSQPVAGQAGMEV
ncbi:MAG: hypothetical protein J6W84_03465 [Bacteroidales bacterium]|nr:hypothetical protein [Bacteroidales bacterium]